MSFSSFKNPATYHLLRYNNCTLQAQNQARLITELQLWHPPRLNPLPVLRLRHRSLPRPPASPILHTSEAHFPCILYAPNSYSRCNAAHLSAWWCTLPASIPLFVSHATDCNRQSEFLATYYHVPHGAGELGVHWAQDDRGHGSEETSGDQGWEEEL